MVTRVVQTTKEMLREEWVWHIVAAISWVLILMAVHRPM